jgi:hypothetical protein
MRNSAGIKTIDDAQGSRENSNCGRMVALGIRASRADRKKYFHAFNSATCSGRDFRLFKLDLLCGDIGAFRRALCTEEGCSYEEAWVIGRRDCGRLSF